MAHHNLAGEEEATETSASRPSNDTTSRGTSPTRHESDVYTNAIGLTVDPERGSNTNVVQWYCENDPKVLHDLQYQRS